LRRTQKNVAASPLFTSAAGELSMDHQNSSQHFLSFAADEAFDMGKDIFCL